MTNRNELERLLAAATEGPWAVCTDATGDTFIASMTDSAETVCEMGAMDTGEGQAQLEADAALICFLRNNAQHYLSLMDEVERLKTENEAAGRNVAQLQRDGVKFCEALRKCSDLVRRYNGRQSEKLDDIPAIVSQALGETHDR